MRFTLATDLDREGEAISWHLVELLRERKMLEGKGRPPGRVPRDHRAGDKRSHLYPTGSIDGLGQRPASAPGRFDYLVGFNLSPLLWKKIKRGLSAGARAEPRRCA